MWREARIGVVIPAYNEERLLRRTLQGVPDYVDTVCVVDDASSDATADVARKHADPRIEVIRHPQNRGVGAAIVTGYQALLAKNVDVMVVMAGDNQMDPMDLPALLEPVVSGRADYAKGNRFVHQERRRMPRLRRWAGGVLSLMTRGATGLGIDDTQCGYTALRSGAAWGLPLTELWPRYGYPNDLLGMLAARGQRVVDVPVRPIYADEQSGIRPWHALVVAKVIVRRWWHERNVRDGRAGVLAARSAVTTRPTIPES